MRERGGGSTESDEPGSRTAVALRSRMAERERLPGYAALDIGGSSEPATDREARCLARASYGLIVVQAASGAHQ